MTKRELLKQKISEAKAAYAAADAAFADAAAYAAATADAAAYAAAYDAANVAAAAARAAHTAANVAAAADYDKHIAILDKAIERAHVATQNCIWKTQVLKYKKEQANGKN